MAKYLLWLLFLSFVQNSRDFPQRSLKTYKWFDFHRLYIFSVWFFFFHKLWEAQKPTLSILWCSCKMHLKFVKMTLYFSVCPTVSHSQEGRTEGLPSRGRQNRLSVVADFLHRIQTWLQPSLQFIISATLIKRLNLSAHLIVPGTE